MHGVATRAAADGEWHGVKRRQRSLPLAKVCRLIEPGPVVLLTAAFAGRSNVMPICWHSMLEFEPAWAGCVVSDRNHSYTLLKASGGCVLNIRTDALAPAFVGCGNSTGTRTDKFERYGLTRSTAERVSAT